jgi:hypothetical protein
MTAGPADPFLLALGPAIERLLPGATGTLMAGARLLVQRVDGRTNVINVGLAAAAWLRTGAPPETGPQAAEAFIRALIGHLAGQTAGPFEAVRRRVLPLVLHPAFFETTDEAAPDAAPLLRFPVVEDELSAALVVPGAGASMHLLSGADLARFGRSLDALRAEAAANLAARVKGRFSLTLTGSAIARVEDAPWARSTLVLLGDVRRRLTEALGEEPLIAIPERDTLVAMAPSAAEAWRPGLARLKQDYDRGVHPLSDALFRATPQGLAFEARLPEAPRDSPAATT